MKPRIVLIYGLLKLNKGACSNINFHERSWIQTQLYHSNRSYTFHPCFPCIQTGHKRFNPKEKGQKAVLDPKIVLYMPATQTVPINHSGTGFRPFDYCIINGSTFFFMETDPSCFDKTGDPDPFLLEKVPPS